MYRYNIVEIPRTDEKATEDALWELGRSGWELVTVVEGSRANPDDRSVLTYFFKRSASEDIGI